MGPGGLSGSNLFLVILVYFLIAVVSQLFIIFYAVRQKDIDNGVIAWDIKRFRKYKVLQKKI